MEVAAIVAVMVILSWMFIFGARPTIVALALSVAVPPAIFGENYALVAAAAAAVCVVIAMPGARADPPTGPPAVASWRRFAPSVLLGFTGVAWLVSGLLADPPLATSVVIAMTTIYPITAVLAFLLSSRPNFAAAVVRAYGWLTSVALLLYVLAWVSGFETVVRLRLPYRHLDIMAPGATTVGSGGFLQPLPRLSFLVGEPGLLIGLVACAAWVAVEIETGWRRLVLLTCAAGVSIASQSTATVVSLVVMAACFIVGKTMQRSGRALGLLVAAALVVPLFLVGVWLVRLKSLTNVSSSRDRGFGAEGYDVSGLAGSITMVGGAFRYPLVVLSLLAIVGLGVALIGRSPATAAVSAGVAVVGLMSQPLQFHAGVWLLLCIFISLGSRTRGAVGGGPLPLPAGATRNGRLAGPWKRISVPPR